MFPTSKPTQRDATSIIWFVGLLYIKKKLFLIFGKFLTTFRCFFFMYSGDESKITKITGFANILARPRDPTDFTYIADFDDEILKKKITKIS